MPRETVTEQCEGCAKIILIDGEPKCVMYEQTSCQWTRVGGCAGRTHNKRTAIEDKEFKLNPLKASKRSRKEGAGKQK